MHEEKLKHIIEDFIGANKEYGIEEICVSTNDGLPVVDVEVKENLYNVQEIDASSALISQTLKSISSVLSIKNAYMVLVLNNSMQICVITKDFISVFILSQSQILGRGRQMLGLGH